MSGPGTDAILQQHLASLKQQGATDDELAQYVEEWDAAHTPHQVPAANVGKTLENGVEVARTPAGVAPRQESDFERNLGRARAATQGLTLGFGDEIGAAVNALDHGGIDPRHPLTSIYKSYVKGRDAERANQGEYAKNHGDENALIQLGAGLIPSTVVGAGLGGVAKGAGLLKQIYQGAKIGGALGGMSGAGYSDSGDTLGDAVSGAEKGAAIGGALPIVARPVTKVVGRLTRALWGRSAPTPSPAAAIDGAGAAPKRLGGDPANDLTMAGKIVEGRVERGMPPLGLDAAGPKPPTPRVRRFDTVGEGSAPPTHDPLQVDAQVEAAANAARQKPGLDIGGGLRVKPARGPDPISEPLMRVDDPYEIASKPVPGETAVPSERVDQRTYMKQHQALSGLRKGDHLEQPIMDEMQRYADMAKQQPDRQLSWLQAAKRLKDATEAFLKDNPGAENPVVRDVLRYMPKGPWT